MKLLVICIILTISSVWAEDDDKEASTDDVKVAKRGLFDYGGLSNLGYGTSYGGYGTGNLGYGSSSLGYGSSSLGYGSGSLGYGSGSLGYGSGSLGYGIGSAGYGTGNVGYGSYGSSYGNYGSGGYGGLRYGGVGYDGYSPYRKSFYGNGSPYDPSTGYYPSPVYSGYGYGTGYNGYRSGLPLGDGYQSVGYKFSTGFPGINYGYKNLNSVYSGTYGTGLGGAAGGYYGNGIW